MHFFFLFIGRESTMHMTIDAHAKENHCMARWLLKGFPSHEMFEARQRSTMGKKNW